MKSLFNNSECQTAWPFLFTSQDGSETFHVAEDRFWFHVCI